MKFQWTKTRGIDEWKCFVGSDLIEALVVEKTYSKDGPGFSPDVFEWSIELPFPLDQEPAHSGECRFGRGFKQAKACAEAVAKVLLDSEPGAE